VHRGVERRHDFTGFEDRFSAGRDAEYQQVAILIGLDGERTGAWSILLKLNDAGTVYVPVAQVAPGLHAPANTQFEGLEKLIGPQAADDLKTYHVWRIPDDAGGRPRNILWMIPGWRCYLVDPGINGDFTKRPDGTEALKFKPPKQN